MRLRAAGSDRLRHLVNARNEGVLGSSPGVGSSTKPLLRPPFLVGGNQGGERTIERLLSVDQTCRLQHRSLYAYLVDALTAKARGDPIPALA
jgi:hypothetical protein